MGLSCFSVVILNKTFFRHTYNICFTCFMSIGACGKHLVIASCHFQCWVKSDMSNTKIGGSKRGQIAILTSKVAVKESRYKVNILEKQS